MTGVQTCALPILFLLARAPEKGQVKARKNANKKAIQWIFAKIPYFYVNVLQGGKTLVRWVKYLSVGAKNLSLGLRICPLVCLFAAFFSQESSKMARPFSRRPDSCHHYRGVFLGRFAPSWCNPLASMECATTIPDIPPSQRDRKRGRPKIPYFLFRIWAHEIRKVNV